MLSRKYLIKIQETSWNVFLIHRSKIIPHLTKIILGDVLYQNSIQKIKYFVICIEQKNFILSPKLPILIIFGSLQKILCSILSAFICVSYGNAVNRKRSELHSQHQPLIIPKQVGGSLLDFLSICFLLSLQFEIFQWNTTVLPPNF